MKILKIVGLGVALVVGLAALGSVTGILSSVVTAPGRVITKTLETDNIIGNYEWFKRQYNDIKAIETRMAIARKTVKDFSQEVPVAVRTFEDKQQYNRLMIILQGLEGQWTVMVAEYNSRSQMANRSIFKTGELPDYFSTTLPQ
jgi:hypothetical protein